MTVDTAVTESDSTGTVIERCYLYRFFDGDDRLLYVGITRSVASRFANHARHAPWWDDVARSAFVVLPNRAAAEYAEAVAIVTEGPIHNAHRPSVASARDRFRSDGLDMSRVVAEVERLRRLSDSWMVRAISAESSNQRLRDEHAAMSERLQWARADVRQSDELTARRVAREGIAVMATQRLQGPTVVRHAGSPAEWSDDA